MGSFKFKSQTGNDAEVRRSTRSSSRVTRSKKRVMEEPAAGTPPAKKARRSRPSVAQKAAPKKGKKAAKQGEASPNAAPASPSPSRSPSPAPKATKKRKSKSPAPKAKPATPKAAKKKQQAKEKVATPPPASPVQERAAKDVPQEELEVQIAAAVINHTAKPAVTIPLYIKQHLKLFGQEMARAVMNDLPRLTPELDASANAPSPYQPSVQEATDVLKRKEITLDAFVTTLLEQKQEWEEVRRVYAEKRKQDGEKKELDQKQRQSLRQQVLADVEVSTDLTSFDSSLQEMASMLNDLNDALSHIRSLNMAGADKVKALAAQMRNRAFKDLQGLEDPKKLMERVASTARKQQG